MGHLGRAVAGGGFIAQPIENQRRCESECTSSGVQDAPPPDHAACFQCGGVHRRLCQTAVGAPRGH
jgi:hypothetical protein